MSDGLAGFGQSISAADLDSNGYPDLVVGSYMTDSALILRYEFELELSILKSFSQGSTARTCRSIIQFQCHFDQHRKLGTNMQQGWITGCMFRSLSLLVLFFLQIQELGKCARSDRK